MLHINKIKKYKIAYMKQKNPPTLTIPIQHQTKLIKHTKKKKRKKMKISKSKQNQKTEETLFKNKETRGYNSNYNSNHKYLDQQIL